MIIYDPLWETMKKKGFTTYTLRVKHGMSSATLQRLRKGMSVSTNTLDDLCKLLKCKLSDVAVYVEDKENNIIEKTTLHKVNRSRRRHMIIYAPLWETMKAKGITIYTLRNKYKMSNATLQRLRKGMSVSTNTLNKLCKLLKCKLSDVAVYVEDIENNIIEHKENNAPQSEQE